MDAVKSVDFLEEFLKRTSDFMPVDFTSCVAKKSNPGGRAKMGHVAAFANLQEVTLGSTPASAACLQIPASYVASNVQMCMARSEVILARGSTTCCKMQDM
jgi:hypothetical protein